MAGQNPVRLVPGGAFARGDDRAHRDVEARRAAERGRAGAKLPHALARRCERLGVDRIDVAQPRAHFERAVGRAAEEDGRMRFLQRPHVGMRAFDLVEVAREIERPLVRPGKLHQFEIFGGAAIALGLRREIAVALLLVVGLAGDDVQDEPAAGEMVEGRDLARHQGRRHEARPVRDEITEPFGARRRVQRDQKALGGRRRVADQHQIEAGRFVGAGGLCHVIRRQAALDDMQGGVAPRRRDADHADDFDGHCALAVIEEPNAIVAFFRI